MILYRLKNPPDCPLSRCSRIVACISSSTARNSLSSGRRSTSSVPGFGVCPKPAFQSNNNDQLIIICPTLPTKHNRLMVKLSYLLLPATVQCPSKFCAENRRLKRQLVSDLRVPFRLKFPT